MGWGGLRGGDLSEGVRAGPGASEVLGTSPGPFVPGQDRCSQLLLGEGAPRFFGSTVGPGGKTVSQGCRSYPCPSPPGMEKVWTLSWGLKLMPPLWQGDIIEVAPWSPAHLATSLEAPLGRSRRTDKGENALWILGAPRDQEPGSQGGLRPCSHPVTGVANPADAPSGSFSTQGSRKPLPVRIGKQVETYSPSQQRWGAAALGVLTTAILEEKGSGPARQGRAGL